MSKKETNNMELFFPYYVNQGRLLDIYAILNGGYSEYTEISSAINTEKTKNGKIEVTATGGFKLFNFGGNIAGSAEKKEGNTNENREKKVQTVTSILSIVKSTLSSKGYLKDINDAKPGDFICVPVILSINSIKSLFTEMSELVKLADNMQKLDSKITNTAKNNNNLANILKTAQTIFDVEEILYQTDDYAIIGNIVDEHLYQAVRADIIGTNLTCLAQIKRVYPEGTELMKNTIFTKMKDEIIKQNFISSITSVTDGNTFDFEATAVTAIYNKPVYQIEIIALYQGVNL